MDHRHIEAAASHAGVDYAEAAARIAAMPQSTRERQEALRARRAMLGMTEVRGVYLPPELHAKLKAEATRLLKKHQPPASGADTPPRDL